MGITDSVTRAAHNAWALFVADGVAPAHETPSVVVGRGPHRTLRRFGPGDGGDPVLLVTPLAASPTCFDLMPDQSVVQYLTELGRSVFVVDYGQMTSEDRDLGLEYWIDDIVPEAIHRVSELCGNRDVDVVAWSIGGAMALLTSAAHPELPVRSITVFGSPLDFSKIPVMAPLRLIGRFCAEPAIGVLNSVFGGVPALLVQAAYRITALDRELARPFFVASNLTDADKLSRMEFVDRFQEEISGYAGRAFAQLAQMTVANDLSGGRLHLGERIVDLADVTAPVLALGGTEDILAPIAAVEPVVRLLPNAPVRFVQVPGTHLGMLTGARARTTSWVELAAFLEEPGVDVPAEFDDPGEELPVSTPPAATRRPDRTVR